MSLPSYPLVHGSTFGSELRFLSNYIRYALHGEIRIASAIKAIPNYIHSLIVVTAGLVGALLWTHDRLIKKNEKTHELFEIGKKSKISVFILELLKVLGNVLKDLILKKVHWFGFHTKRRFLLFVTKQGEQYPTGTHFYTKVSV
jgi:hypothetical protein